jgi:hypothetical protein
VLFGLCFGNVVTLPSIFQHEFARASLGRLLGLSTAIGRVAYALIPTILGAIRDVAGGPRAGLQLPAATLMTLGSVSKRSSLRKADYPGSGHQDRMVPPHL